MNIFYLDQDIQTCVEYHCDKHVVKMPLETTQMLCTVYHRYGAIAPYKPVHAKHPCTLWAGNNVLNYKWLWDFGKALCKEYTYRYDKVHACENILEQIKIPPIELFYPLVSLEGTRQRPQCMPDEYKDPQDTVNAYRQYYQHTKASFCVWKKRTVPSFMKKFLVKG
mgnify:FL=1